MINNDKKAPASRKQAPIFSVCATHGASLDGERPLWGYVATNH
jgi:hypothetical protein